MNLTEWPFHKKRSWHAADWSDSAIIGLMVSHRHWVARHSLNCDWPEITIFSQGFSAVYKLLSTLSSISHGLNEISPRLSDVVNSSHGIFLFIFLRQSTSSHVCEKSDSTCFELCTRRASLRNFFAIPAETSQHIKTLQMLWKCDKRLVRLGLPASHVC